MFGTRGSSHDKNHIYRSPGEGGYDGDGTYRTSSEGGWSGNSGDYSGGK